MEDQEKCCLGDGDQVKHMQSANVDPASIEEMAALFKALGDARRLQIIQMIAAQPGICACELIEDLEISASSLSRHTRILGTAGLVTGYRKGKWMHYSLSKQGFAAAASCLERLQHAQGINTTDERWV